MRKCGVRRPTDDDMAAAYIDRTGAVHVSSRETLDFPCQLPKGHEGDHKFERSVQCNACDAVGPWVHWASRSIREARREARLQGWTHHGHADYCPPCTESRRKAAALKGEK